ncbi:mechanosensitive ion channel family protein [Hydrogenophaga sp. 5NK40-0174]|uniref:mechanosensitive ion channel family protein n=1 Tax=Hydrogenophaga sp. 5NK40-0174 TaxID=3127649 RepID=UPI00310A4A71
MNKEDLISQFTAWWSELDAVAIHATRIVGIIIVSWILVIVLNRVIRGVRERIAARVDDREFGKRAETLGRVFRYIVSVVVSLIAIMLILSELGISVAPILGAAGVVGLAVGFGAQSLVKDYFTGFFLLLENQILQGDVVQLGDHSGLVEGITLRYVQLRDYEGNVHFVPNGTITSVVNMSRGYSYAVMDIGVGYREDIDTCIEVMRQTASQLKQDPEYTTRILDELDVAGVDSWGDSAVVIRCRFRCQPLEQWGIRREYLRRLKYAFDAKGIEIPFPHMTLYAGEDREGKAPYFHVAQDGPNRAA